MAQSHAEKFLEKLENDKKMRDAVKALPHVVAVGKEHGFEFTNAELSRALKKKWGSPEKRKDKRSESFTCCCI
jgi:predicted ribosomally synthesized peptide with nif11-like leader